MIKPSRLFVAIEQIDLRNGIGQTNRSGKLC